MAQIKTHALATGIWLVLASQVSFAQEADSAPATQSADAADPTTLDRIEVTGSRIRHVDIETAQPIQMITRDEIDKQGFESVADILRSDLGRLPVLVCRKNGMRLAASDLPPSA